MYIDYEIRSMPTYPTILSDDTSGTKEFRDFGYHRIMLAGGMLDLPEDLYIVNPLTGTLKFPVS
tara:strand:- start:1016 stop:1207 length:192 start_codon:yes stop_codon:yes gene_type:complete